jgi:hypothetical protein
VLGLEPLRDIGGADAGRDREGADVVDQAGVGGAT